MKQVAAQIGKTESWYCKVEHGDTGSRMTIDTTYALANVLGMTIDEYMNEETRWKEEKKNGIPEKSA